MFVDGGLRLMTVQPEGKAAMPWAAFANGARPTPGAIARRHRYNLDFTARTPRDQRVIFLDQADDAGAHGTKTGESDT